MSLRKELFQLRQRWQAYRQNGQNQPDKDGFKFFGKHR